VQNILQSKLSFNPGGNNSDVVKNLLLKRIQQYPDRSIYSELLTWLFVQQKQFEAAFIQSKALDKRYNEDGYRLINLAFLCVSNESYDVAIKAYQYVIAKEKTTSYYVTARTELLNTINKKIISSGNSNQQELLELENNYIKTLDELGRSAATASMIRNLAHLQAFYLYKIDDAISLLQEVIKIPGIRQQDIGEYKLELGDVYLLKNEVWEATLLYSQVDKAFKTDMLGQEAKYRNAKLSYFQGDFDWSKAQLDILKSATSDLMSNDALYLSLLIGDNLADGDTLQTTLHIYSRADLLLFQNKYDQALTVLDSIKIVFSSSSLNDDVLFKKGNIMEMKADYEVAAKFYQEIVENYSKDILADDALFKLALLNETKFNNSEKAMSLYQDLMTNYPSSTYVVEARKKFRLLRGDLIN
jgi:tetratricopeptide (TPR) repeat protein